MRNDEPFVAEVTLHLRAGYPALSVDTPEEMRAVAALAEAGNRVLRKDAAAHERLDELLEKLPEFAAMVGPNPTIPQAAEAARQLPRDQAKLVLDEISLVTVTYDTVLGFSVPGAKGKQSSNELHVDDPYGAILSLLSVGRLLPSHCLVVFKDIHRYLADTHNPRMCRALRSVLEADALAGLDLRRHVVLLQPDWTLPQELAHLVTRVDFRPPGPKELGELVDSVATSVAGAGNKSTKLPDAVRQAMADSLAGMTKAEAVNALYLTGARRGVFTVESVPDLHEQKAKTFANDGILSYASAEEIAAAPDVGGYDDYLSYIAECRACMTHQAVESGIRRPKGVLLLGVPGSGKSTVATLTAKQLGLPLIRYDVSAVFNSLVGESETRQRAALRRVSAAGPCVLLVDEVDKSLAGAGAAGGDSGTTQRVFGRLLTWLSSENKTAFVLMTANRLVDKETGKQVIPVETLRAGRIDAVFYTTFPSADERERIFEIHMARNRADWSAVSKLDRTRLLQLTDGYVGSEIEQVVVAAVRRAFMTTGSHQPTGEQLADAVAQVTPVKVLDPDGIAAMDKFAKERARPVGRTAAVSGSVRSRRTVN